MNLSLSKEWNKNFKPFCVFFRDSICIHAYAIFAIERNVFNITLNGENRICVDAKRVPGFIMKLMMNPEFLITATKTLLRTLNSMKTWPLTNDSTFITFSLNVLTVDCKTSYAMALTCVLMGTTCKLNIYVLQCLRDRGNCRMFYHYRWVILAMSTITIFSTIPLSHRLKINNVK
jgi:hypothetical protein